MACNKLCFGDDPIQIQDLLYGSVKTRYEHVVNNENAHVSCNALILATEGYLETLDAALVFALVRVFF